MPPLTFSEGFAIAAGLVQLFVAAVFLRFRHGRPEWGLGWWCVTYLAAGVMNTAAPVLLGAMHSPLGDRVQLLTLVLGISAMGALVAAIGLGRGLLIALFGGAAVAAFGAAAPAWTWCACCRAGRTRCSRSNKTRR
mgnify:CR=1 FL=1